VGEEMPRPGFRRCKFKLQHGNFVTASSWDSQSFSLTLSFFICTSEEITILEERIEEKRVIKSKVLCAGPTDIHRGTQMYLKL
jgi:hypothetical protein